GHFVGQPFEFAAADVLEVPAQRVVRRFFVEIDRYAEAGGDGLAHVACERDALGHRDAFDRYERHDVNRTDSRMFTRLSPEINAWHGSLVERQDGLRERRP